MIAPGFCRWKMSIDPAIMNKEAEHTRHARTNPTVAALMARGLDSDTANMLRRLGLTLAELKRRTDDELAPLNLTAAQVAALRKGARPPIPFDTLVQVL
jgi:hypothetical protein